MVEKTQSMERERHCREIENLRRSEQEARAKAETLPSLLEQLSFLQHELDNTRRQKEDLEEQSKVYKEQTQQVGLLHSPVFAINYLDPDLPQSNFALPQSQNELKMFLHFSQ